MTPRMFAPLLLISILAGSVADACSRIVHTSQDGRFVVARRSMDWFEDIQSNLWVLPRAMKRTANVKQNPLTWTSKYGSVTTTGVDVGIADGMNEKGLVATLSFYGEITCVSFM